MSMPNQIVDTPSIYASEPFVIAPELKVSNSIEVKRVERGANSVDLDQNPFSKSGNIGTFQNIDGLAGSLENEVQNFNRNSDGLDIDRNRQ